MEDIQMSYDIETKHETRQREFHADIIANPYQKHIIYKELTKEDELMQMFALRYSVYRHVDFVPENSTGMDIDCYDRFSTFLGAFECIGDSRRLIGCVRIISGNEESRTSEIVEAIAARFGFANEDDFYERPALFPIQETFTLPEEYVFPFEPEYQYLKNLGIYHKPYEISRLAVIPEYWGANERIEKGLRDLIIFSSWNSNPQKNIYLIAVNPRTRRHYERLGFKRIPNCEETIYHRINKPAIAMVITMEQYFNELDNYYDNKISTFPFQFNIQHGQFVQSCVA